MLKLSITFLLVALVAMAIPLAGLYLYSLYKLFEKCGVKGWKALIPFYNKLILLGLSGTNWWWVVVYVGAFILSIDASAGLWLLCLLIVTFVNSLIAYNFCRRMNNGKNSLIIDILLYTFLPIIWTPVMAFNDEFNYDGSVKVTANSYIDIIQTSDFGANKETSKKKTKKESKIIHKFCDKCGQPVLPTNNYCPNCGKKI